MKVLASGSAGFPATEKAKRVLSFEAITTLAHPDPRGAASRSG
jgi:hypothetical protein